MHIQLTSQLITVAALLISVVVTSCALVAMRYRFIQEQSCELGRNRFNLVPRIEEASDRIKQAPLGSGGSDRIHGTGLYRTHDLIAKINAYSPFSSITIGLAALKRSIQLVKVSKRRST